MPLGNGFLESIQVVGPRGASTKDPRSLPDREIDPFMKQYSLSFGCPFREHERHLLYPFREERALKRVPHAVLQAVDGFGISRLGKKT